MLPNQGKINIFYKTTQAYYDAIMVSLYRKHELFRQYKNGIVSFDHYNSFKNNFTTTLHHA